MKNIKTVFAALVIILAVVVAIVVYKFVLGNPANFIEGNTDGEPVKEGVGSYLGVIYKGGIIVPILIAMLLIVITFTVERMLTIAAAKGNGSVDAFISRIRALVSSGDFSAAEQECDRQKGSVANVVKAGLHMYKQMEKDQELDKERKILAIQKELEEAT